MVTGIFVTDAVGRADADRDVAAALRDAKRDAIKAELISVFRETDIDQSGEISVEELYQMLQSHDIQTLLASIGIEAMDHKKFFHALDVDKDGAVNLDEFIYGVDTLAGQSRQMDLLIFQAEMKSILQSVCVKQNEMGALQAAGHEMMADMKEREVQARVALDEILEKLAKEEILF